MSYRIQKFTMWNCALRQAAVIGFAAMALLTVSTPAQASNMIVNGGFESTTFGPGQLGFNTDATGWTSSGYTFLFADGTADTTGSDGSLGNVQLWGPNNGSANGLPGTSPDGGNFVAADGAFEVGAITQTVTGLTAGDNYIVGFWWAGAQQEGFSGATTEQWAVSFGLSQTQSTDVVSNDSQGFTGWQYQTLAFTADGASDLLSFVAVGTPEGVPPFVLLDGVSLDSATPEPETLTLLLGGLIGVLGVLKSKNWFRR